MAIVHVARFVRIPPTTEPVTPIAKDLPIVRQIACRDLTRRLEIDTHELRINRADIGHPNQKAQDQAQVLLTHCLSSCCWIIVLRRGMVHHRS